MPSELPELFDVLRRPFLVVFLLAEGFAQSGTGYNRSNCRRNRLVYSLPLIKSSDSATLSFRNRGFDANETVMRSSSLSTHAALSSSFNWASLSAEVGAGKSAGTSTAEGPESRKNS